ncbi:LIP5 [Mytilus edulis]|uniref:VTA1 n=1 Tax=Mytilus edulis TaxID=6550 RepID=A0A8S3SM53_MYTED|nr:LIP5 [Mytilus edulis]
MSHLPPLPASLKPIQHYLKTANEHDKRDPVVSYYCQLYAMQNGMEVDKKSKEARTFLFALMDYLEKFKTEHSENDAITSEVVGQAHMENYALKVFLFADNEDRAGRFNKNVVKSFYTAGMLFDVLGCFGEISEDIQKNRKYAKWKAAYIHKCLKNGETPVPGPLGGEDGEEGLSPADNLQPGPSYPANNLPTPVTNNHK